VFLSIGVIGLVYDVWIRENVREELLQMVRLKESLAESGLTEVRFKSHADWASVLCQARDFTLLPRDVSTFATHHWSYVIEAGRERRINVSVLLPSGSSPSLASLEVQLGCSTGTLKNLIDGAREVILKSWDSAEVSQPPLRPGSTLGIYEYEDFPSCSVFATEELVALEVDACLNRQPLEQGVVLLFDNRHPKQHFSWALDQVQRAMDGVNLVDSRKVS
jgi:hypothetical protein